MGIKRDPIEKTEAFVIALKKIEPELDKISKELEDEYGMGSCHIYWVKKKELLKQVGVDWKTPAEMNPNIMFD